MEKKMDYLYGAINGLATLVVSQENIELAITRIASSTGIGVITAFIPGCEGSEDRRTSLLDCMSFNDDHQVHIANAESVKLPTKDGLNLDAVWVPLKNEKERKSSPTVMLFHGSGYTLEGLRLNAKWYQKQNMNVLLLNIRSYGESEDKNITELGLYYDVAAAVDFVVKNNINKNRLFAHGHSLGGALAASAGYYFDMPVVLDKTFTNAKDVAQNITKHIVSLVSVPNCLVNGIVNASFPEGIEDPIQMQEMQEMQKKQFITDGLNTIKKVKNLDFFAFFGTDDNAMPIAFADEFRKVNKNKDQVAILSSHSQSKHYSTKLEKLDGATAIEFQKFINCIKNKEIPWNPDLEEDLEVGCSNLVPADVQAPAPAPKKDNNNIDEDEDDWVTY